MVDGAKNKLEKWSYQSRRLPKTYTVKTGDSWFKIAGAMYGDQRMGQALANYMENAKIGGLRAGMTLQLPRPMRPGQTAYVSPGFMGQAAPVAPVAGVARTAIPPVVGGGYVPQTAAYAPAPPTGMAPQAVPTAWDYYPSPAPYVPAVTAPAPYVPLVTAPRRTVPVLPPNNPPDVFGTQLYLDRRRSTVPIGAPAPAPSAPIAVPPVNQWPGYRGPRPAAAPRPTIQAPTIGALPPGWTRPPAVPAGAPVQYQPKVPGIRPTGGMTAPPPAGGGYVPATASTMQQPKRYPTVGGVAPGPKPGPGWTQNPTTGGWYPQFSSVTTQLIEQGIRPLVIQWNDPLLATADKPTDMELTAAGYLKDDYGNWINTVPTAQPAAAAAPGGGGGGGGGGGYGYGRGGGGGGGGGGSGISPVYARNAGRFGSTYAPGRAASGGRPGVARLGPAVTGVVSWRI